MGTRADFYIGTGPSAEWLGSVAWDGYEWAEAEDSPLMASKTEEDFRSAVSAIKESREDFTSPENGWPWPWNNSSTTDYTYFFIDGKSSFEEFSGRGDWPDMSSKKNVQIGGKRSGTIVIV